VANRSGSENQSDFSLSDQIDFPIRELLNSGSSQLTFKQKLAMIAYLLQGESRENLERARDLLDDQIDALFLARTRNTSEKISVEIKPQGPRNYLYFRRSVAGLTRYTENKCIASLPILPGRIYRTDRNQTFQVIRFKPYDTLTWEETVDRKVCLVDLLFLSESGEVQQFESLEYPKCLETLSRFSEIVDHSISPVKFDLTEAQMKRSLAHMQSIVRLAEPYERDGYIWAVRTFKRESASILSYRTQDIVRLEKTALVALQHPTKFIEALTALCEKVLEESPVQSFSAMARDFYSLLEAKDHRTSEDLFYAFFVA